MTQFAYTVSDPRTGHRSRGLLLAEDHESALRQLNARNLVVTRLEPTSTLWERLGVRQRGKVSLENILVFTQQTAAMLGAGMPINEILEIQLGDARDPAMRALLLDMLTRVNGGSALSDVIASYPDTFSTVYLTLVATVEASGDLPRLMARLAEMLDRQITLRNKLRAAFYYPAFVLSFAAILLGLLFIFGVPLLEHLYEGIGVSLPLPTRILISIGDLVRHNWHILLLLGILAWLMATRATRTLAGRAWRDNLLLHLPVLGVLVRNIAISRFARTLGTLYHCGVPIVNSMELVAQSMGNVVLEGVTRRALANLMEGQTLTEPLRRSGYFSEMAVSMIGAGESSGKLDEMLEQLSSYYERQVDIALNGMAALLEPLIMVGVGIAVGAMIIAMILPIFTLSQFLLNS
jgi:type II secretory pathway component PulF